MQRHHHKAFPTDDVLLVFVDSGDFLALVAFWLVSTRDFFFFDFLLDGLFFAAATLRAGAFSLAATTLGFLVYFVFIFIFICSDTTGAKIGNDHLPFV